MKAVLYPNITIINDYYNELFDFLKRSILLSKNRFEEYIRSNTRPIGRTLSLETNDVELKNSETN